MTAIDNTVRDERIYSEACGMGRLFTGRSKRVHRSLFPCVLLLRGWVVVFAAAAFLVGVVLMLLTFQWSPGGLGVLSSSSARPIANTA